MVSYQVPMQADVENNFDEEHLILDISGTCFQIRKESLNSFPNSLPFQLWNFHKTRNGQLPRGVYQSQISNRFFIQRSPIVFTIILQCYNTGKLHVPRWMCTENMMEEIKFWKLDAHFACVCSPDDLFDSGQNNDETSDTFESNSTTVLSKLEQKKRAMWRFFQKPNSSQGATIFAAVSIMFILLSTIAYILESIPELQTKQICNIHNESDYVLVGGFFMDVTNASASGGNETDDVNNERSDFEIYFTNCLSMQIFKGIETVCVFWFTLELTARFLVCPNKFKFLIAPLNIIDFMASCNIYLELLLVIMKYGRNDLNNVFIKAIKIVRTVTVLRILKFIRYFEDLRLLVKTFKSAKKELGMLCIFVMVTVLIYSCLLYEIEKDSSPDSLYNSVPASAWWSIVTLTTVGFGDVVPKSPLGKIVGGFACVTGIIIIALPVSVLVEHFTAAYKKKMKTS